MTSPGVHNYWQTYKKTIRSRAKYLLVGEKWSDCRFIVGTEPNQKVFNVHKLFLAMSSPVFEAMFFGEMAEKNDPIPILDVQPEAFKALLDYIYGDEVNLPTFDLACELCYVAKKYLLPDLVERCTEHLWHDLYPRNACRAYEFAKLFEEPKLMEKSLQIIFNETEAVLQDPSFEEVELATLLFILEKQALNISSEIDLFNAVHRWAIKECARKNLSDDAPSLQSVIGSALEKIHFLTLTPSQFAEGPALSPLLSREDSFAILINISSPGGNFPLPPGFSTNREQREKFRLITLPEVSVLNGSSVVDEHKYFCVRGISGLTACHNTSILDCSVNFTVDQNVYVLGIQVPTQVQVQLPDQQKLSNSQDPATYTELLYAHLLDSDGSRLTYTHYTSRVAYNQLVEINFNRPGYIQKNKVYRVVVVLNKQGWYPLGSACHCVSCDDVQFSFGVGLGSDNVRDGFIRSIVFSYE